MFVFGLRPSTIDSMSEGSLSQVWEMPAIAPTAQNRRRTDGAQPRCRQFSRAGVAPQRGNCLADDAVSCELVSTPNSLLTGKLTGNFAVSGHPRRFPHLINEPIQRLAGKFPTQRNREFPNAYQGIFSG